MAGEEATQQGEETTPAATETTAPTASGGTPKVDLNTVLAENARLQTERDKAIGQAQGMRKQALQAFQAKAELERRLNERGEMDFTPATTPSAYDADVVADIAEVKFKQNTPDWNKVIDPKTSRSVWDEMNTILFDDVQANELAGRTPYLTLKNIYREVQNRRMSAQLKERQTTSPQRQQILAHAEMSGQGANAPVPTIDISDPNLTEAQLLEAADRAGMLDEFVDPLDPPSWMRK